MEFSRRYTKCTVGKRQIFTGEAGRVDRAFTRYRDKNSGMIQGFFFLVFQLSTKDLGDDETSEISSKAELSSIFVDFPFSRFSHENIYPKYLTFFIVSGRKFPGK